LPGKLLETLTGLLTSPQRLSAMAAAARTQAHPAAAEEIAGRLEALARESIPAASAKETNQAAHG
jgi:UDP-N-acetylglucosamine--N-acetylmuramyl-(pentapeptide) pyrophosphoryl-undecaprenol N-acetylglucosamine transferase